MCGGTFVWNGLLVLGVIRHIQSVSNYFIDNIFLIIDTLPCPLHNMFYNLNNTAGSFDTLSTSYWEY